ncbi:MAG: response regulator RpfG family c-di-GMP phosphodiesterase [Oceanospirillaceae bacterium]|jgi:response regulator RpfG family c-di-GMP phosphodiesterase
MYDFLIDDVEIDQSIETNASQTAPWNILIVDDEQSVHDVTRFALDDVSFEGKKLHFISALSGRDAKSILTERDDIAIVLLDVVMETDTEWLKITKWIRDELKNSLIRIILRTGQPGQAPEKQVIVDYDINDYKNKTELTSQKLFSSVISGIRSYRDLSALNQNRIELKRVIKASSHIFKERYLHEFTSGALNQLTTLLYLEPSDAVVNTTGVAALETSQEVKVVAAIGEYQHLIGQNPNKIIPKPILDDWLNTTEATYSIIKKNEVIVSLTTDDNHKSLVYLYSHKQITEDAKNLIELFVQNITIAHENLRLWQEVEETQNEIISMLSGAVETRSQETGNHIIRVSKISELLARKIGLHDDEVYTIKLASPLHDIGKVGIPDHILNKPGKHTPEEWEIMKSHSLLGAQVLSSSKRPIIQSGAIIALQHHEKWDGSGYPSGLSGEDIHIFARITAVADVFDALCSNRCYKKAWTVENTMQFIRDQSGVHFDPALVSLLNENLDLVLQIQKKHADPNNHINI